MNVNITSLSYPNEVFNGEITSISQVLDKEAKVLKARVVLNNENLKFKPGMLVDVKVDREINLIGVRIPTDAVVFDQNQNFVIVYKDNCNVEIREVEIMTTNSKETFLGSGLSNNEKIISKNQLLVYEQIKNFQN